MSYGEVDSENTDIPESVRRERRIRKANEERPLRPEEVSEAYETGNFNKLADRYEELGYDTLAKQYRNKVKKKNKHSKVIQAILSFIAPIGLVALILLIGNIKQINGNLISTNVGYSRETEAEADDTIESKQESETETDSSIWVTTTHVKVRTEPNTNCDVLGVLDAGVQVDYKGDTNSGWAIVNYNGQDAYVSKEYLAVEKFEEYEDNTETSAVETSDIMSQAQDLSTMYKDVARNPNQYIGQTFYVTYYVSDVRVAQDSGIRGQVYYTGYYFDIDEFKSLGGNYNYYDIQSLISASIDKPIWLNEKRNENDPEYIKILEGDVIKVYGIFTGMIETENGITGEHGEIMGLDLYSVELIYG